MALNRNGKNLNYLAYCSHHYHHYEENEEGTERSCCQHHCFCLHPAETGHYALPACLQMLLCYYRFPHYDQESIAHHFDLSGKGIEELVAQIQSVLSELTYRHFEPKFRHNIDREMVKSEITTERRPFMLIGNGAGASTKSIPAWTFQICAGFKEESRAGQPGFLLHIFDPLPTPIGKVFYQPQGETDATRGSYLAAITLERRKDWAPKK
jgi:hypothetical protein